MAVSVFSGNLFVTEAAYISVFGPQTYVRTTGAPNHYTETFDTTALEGRLVIKNGEADASHRITSAIITLNGQRIFAPNDFKKADYLLEASISIQEMNQLDIELRSKPGGYLSIEIIPTVQPPVITSSPVLTGAEDTLYIYNVEAMDPDGDDLAYSLSVFPSGMAIDPATGMIQWTPPQEQVGDHSVTVKVTDTDGLSVSQSFVVTVVPVNDPPVIDPVGDQMMDETATLSVGISASDVDNASLTLSVSGMPAFATLTDNGDGTGALTFSPGYDDSGDYPVTVTVSDGELIDSDTFTLAVNNVNRLPEITSSPVEPGAENLPYVYDVEAVDPAGNDIQYSLLQSPNGMTINSLTGLIQWLPTREQIGDHEITIEVVSTS